MAEISRLKLEIACFNRRSALIAADAGADRIELCSGMAVGGTTPDLRDLEALSSSVSIPINVMIRPRGGNFLYTHEEFQQMLTDIENFKHLASGFVFGVLNADSSVSLSENEALVKAANPLPCTFHRAFDEVANMEQALQDVITCGFKSILTSGGRSTAYEGSAALRYLVNLSQGVIEIIVGGSVRSSNIQALEAETKATWFHSSAIINSSEGLTSRTEVQELRAFLNNFDWTQLPRFLLHTWRYASHHIICLPS